MSQLFSVNTLGGYFTNNKLTKKVRHRAQPIQKFRQFTMLEDAAGKKAGDKVYFDKISNIVTAGGTLSETSTIPKSNFTITQGSLTMTEYGNSIDYTQKLETLGDINTPESIVKVLTNDQATVLDSAAAAEYQTSDYKAVCESTASTVFSSAQEL